VKPAAFAYHRPGSLEDALSLLARLGDDAKVLAGGQSLVPMMNMRLARPRALVDVNRLRELSALEVHDGKLWVSALVRQSDAARSRGAAEAVPLLALAIPFVGHWQTRNRGTVCGSLAHADPSAELPLVLVALDGVVEARSVRGTRTIAARDLFESYFTTTLSPDELIVRAGFPVQAASGKPEDHGRSHGESEREGFAFEEFAERHGDFAIVAAACALRLKGGVVASLRVVLGGVAERPWTVRHADRLVGCGLDGAAIEECAHEAARELEPPSDRRASAAFRRHLAAVLTKRTLGAALAAATGGQPARPAQGGEPPPPVKSAEPPVPLIPSEASEVEGQRWR
jgi:CO/xanthine dehydrogenase FAD-binding subunit